MKLHFKLSTVDFVILLTLGAGVRIFGVWTLRHHINADAGIVALMARHMALGRQWPAFFYGQAYMGSFEPAVSALFCRLLGISGFAVGLGTAFLSWLTLPVIYAWARDARDRTAGLAATAFCLIGPAGFFHYNVSPRGGYAATLLLGTFCLWMGAKIAAGYRAAGRLRAGDFILLGLAGGVGWWSNQLVTAALLATAAVMAVFIHRRLLSRHTIYAAIAFAAGSLPFWWFNAAHGWPTFAFRGTFGRVGAAEGLRLFFRERLPAVLGIHVPHPVFRIYPWLVTGALLVSLLVIVWSYKKRSAARPFLLAIVLFALFSAVIFSVSHFATFRTPRYLLPLVPALAVAFGVAVSRLAERFRLPTVLLTLAVIGSQATVFGWAPEYMRQSGKRARSYLALADWAEVSGRRYFHGDYDYHSMNFLTEERVVLAAADRERHLPYAEALESAESIAVVGNYGDVAEFLSRQGGGAFFREVAGIPIHYDFSSPRRNLEPIPADRIARAVNARGLDILPLFSSRTVEAVWRPAAGLDSDKIEVIFETPQTVSMLRLYTPRRTEYPLVWHLEVLDEPGGMWRLLVPPTHHKDYHWSGPRLYSWGDYPRFEVFFEPVEVAGLRLGNHPYRADWRLTPRIAQLFGPGEELPEEASALPRLVERLDELEITRIYADRYAAHRVAKMTDGRIDAPRDSYVRAHWEIDREPRSGIGPDLAFVVRMEDAPFCRAVLETASLEADELVLPPWVVFHFQNQNPPDENRPNHPLIWTGFSPVLTGLWPGETMFWNAAGTHRRIGTNETDGEGRSFRVAHPGTDPGAMAFGKYLNLEPNNRYRASFELRTAGEGARVRLDVAINKGRKILAEQDISLPPDEERTYLLEFKTPPRSVQAETRVHYDGGGKVMIGRMGLEQLSP